MAGWPRLLLEIFKLDEFGRNDVVGYGMVDLPKMHGSHELECNTWRPRGDRKQEYNGEWEAVFIFLFPFSPFFSPLSSFFFLFFLFFLCLLLSSLSSLSVFSWWSSTIISIWIKCFVSWCMGIKNGVSNSTIRYSISSSGCIVAKCEWGEYEVVVVKWGVLECWLVLHVHVCCKTVF